MPVDVAEPRWCGEAAALLRHGVPAACQGLTPYDSHYFSRFLATAGSVPERHRTLLLRGELDRERLLAVADWRLVGSVLYLSGLAVLPSARGRGLGRNMLADGMELAAELGASLVEADLPETGGKPADLASGRLAPAGERLFAGFGFAPAGRSSWWELAWSEQSGSARTGDLDGWTTAWRIRNWPAYAAGLQAYGFADLEVTGTEPTGPVRLTIQVLPGGWRIGRADRCGSLVRSLAPVLGHRPGRVFMIAAGSPASVSPGSSAVPIAVFHRLRRTV